MNNGDKKLEGLDNYTKKLGILYYPVLDQNEHVIENAYALIGFYNATEFRMCARAVNGKLTNFKRSADNKFMILLPEEEEKNDYQSIPEEEKIRGIFLNLKSVN